MQPLRKRRLALVLIALLLAGSALTIYYGVISGPVAGPGVYLSLSLHGVREGGLIDATSILDRPDTLMYLEVNAITPPSPKWPEDIITIFKDNIKAKREVYIKSEELQEMAKEWVSTYESRRGNPGKTYSGLIIRIFIYSATTGDIIFEVYDSISYKPSEVAKGKAVKIDINMLKGPHKAVKLDVKHDYVKWYEELRAKIGEAKLGSCPVHIYRELKVEVKPEYLKSELPEDYFININGRLYMKTPVLIVENVNPHSSTVNAFVGIGAHWAKTGAYPTFTSGKIIENITRGLLPNVTLWKGSGFTWRGTEYYYGHGGGVPPLRSIWAWIWARPIFRMYEVYRADCIEQRYIRDDVESFIGDVLTINQSIKGNLDLGLPHKAIMDNFLKGVDMVRLHIPGTYLADGYLNPGEFITSAGIYEYFDRCDGDFDIVIPVGAMAALAICPILDIDAAACTAAITFVSAFHVSLSSVTVGLENSGDLPYIPNDYNVSEVVYVAVSKYQYKVDPPFWCPWCSPCYSNVPAGIYFRCD